MISCLKSPMMMSLALLARIRLLVSPGAAGRDLHRRERPRQRTRLVTTAEQDDEEKHDDQRGALRGAARFPRKYRLTA